MRRTTLPFFLYIPSALSSGDMIFTTSPLRSQAPLHSMMPSRSDGEWLQRPHTASILFLQTGLRLLQDAEAVGLQNVQYARKAMRSSSTPPAAILLLLLILFLLALLLLLFPRLLRRLGGLLPLHQLLQLAARLGRRRICPLLFAVGDDKQRFSQIASRPLLLWGRQMCEGNSEQ